MDDLKSWYLENLSIQLDALESARSAFGQGSKDAPETIRRIAHALKGSGGTYGFPDVSEAAGRLEEAPSSATGERLDVLIQTLRRWVSKERSEKAGILIVDDDPLFLEVLKQKLSSGNRDVHLASSLLQAEQVLEAKLVSLILLDLMLPDADGRNFLLQLRENPRTASIPVFILSARRGTAALKAECYALGAEHYFEKHADMDLLSAAVSKELSREALLAKRLHADPLTGLMNRSAFGSSFVRHVSLSYRNRHALTLAMLDLDHFKSVNDTYGHHMGDDVLKQFAELLRTHLRKSDIIARWGGEEFVVLFPDTDRSGAVEALQKVLSAFRQTGFPVKDGNVFYLTFSAGVMQVFPWHTLQEAIEAADALLYLAKNQGRSRIVCEDRKEPSAPVPVLMADDDETMVHRVRELLVPEGFSVHAVSDGAKVLKLANARLFSLVILDVKLPHVDGFELLSRLRKYPAYAQVPIVMLTSMGQEKDVVRGLDLGADDYVLKPFAPQELLARIQRLLKRA